MLKVTQLPEPRPRHPPARCDPHPVHMLMPCVLGGHACLYVRVRNKHLMRRECVDRLCLYLCGYTARAHGRMHALTPPGATLEGLESGREGAGAGAAGDVPEAAQRAREKKERGPPCSPLLTWTPAPDMCARGGRGDERQAGFRPRCACSLPVGAARSVPGSRAGPWSGWREQCKQPSPALTRNLHAVSRWPNAHRDP